MAIQPAKNIWVAAGDGDLSRVRELVEHHGLSPNVPDAFTYTPMHAAASYGQRHILEYLISRGGDVNLTDDEGDTPLYTVEEIETAQFLVQNGATLNHQNSEGVSPIEHLEEEFPQVAAYLESLLPASADAARGPTSDALPPTLPSQHSQNAVSERLTNDLVQQVQDLARRQGDADVGEEELRRVVTTSVMEGLARGRELQEGTPSQAAEGASEKRTRLE